MPSEYQNYEKGVSDNSNQQFVAEAVGYDRANGWLTLDVKNRFELQDQLELITPRGNQVFQLSALESAGGKRLDAAPGSGHRVRIPMVGRADSLNVATSAAILLYEAVRQRRRAV